MYDNDLDFVEMYESCKGATQGKFFISNGYLVYLDKLCNPSCSIHDLLVKEWYDGG